MKHERQHESWDRHYHQPWSTHPRRRGHLTNRHHVYDLALLMQAVLLEICLFQCRQRLSCKSLAIRLKNAKAKKCPASGEQHLWVVHCICVHKCKFSKKPTSRRLCLELLQKSLQNDLAEHRSKTGRPVNKRSATAFCIYLFSYTALHSIQETCHLMSTQMMRDLGP